MKRLLPNPLLCAALCVATSAHAQGLAASTPAPLPSSPAKKELVQKILAFQQPGIEGLARSMVEQPAIRMMQEANRVLQQLPQDKREAAGKSSEADAKKFVDESTPIVRDRAIKLAPSTIGAMLEERFTEDELKQLAAWLDSPVNKKYTQLGQEMQNNFTKKLVDDVRPLIEPRLQALEAKVRTDLGLPPAGAATSAPASAPTAAPAKAASPAKKAASK